MKNEKTVTAIAKEELAEDRKAEKIRCAKSVLEQIECMELALKELYLQLERLNS